MGDTYPGEIPLVEMLWLFDCTLGSVGQITTGTLPTVTAGREGPGRDGTGVKRVTEESYGVTGGDQETDPGRRRTFPWVDDREREWRDGRQEQLLPKVLPEQILAYGREESGEPTKSKKVAQRGRLHTVTNT